MRLGQNLFAGVGASLWAAAIGLAVVPIYLRYLGIEAYGLIGFFATMQSVMMLLDAGLSTAMSREIARNTIVHDQSRARNILHSFATVYWIVAILIMAGVASISNGIAGYWLSSATMNDATIARAVTLMGLVIACRWPTSIYMGALTGAERLVAANVVVVTCATIGSLGAVLVLAFVSPTIEAFFLWQAVVGILNVIMMRSAAIKALGGGSGHFDDGTLRQVWRFSAAMTGVTLSAILFSQLDKIVLSRTLPLAEFGAYMLATTVASILYRLITPLFNVIYPRFSAFVAIGDLRSLLDFYRVGTNLFAIFLFPLAMAMALSAEAAVTLWTGNGLLAGEVAPLIALLSLGSAIHGMMYFPYSLQLAHGYVGLPLKINILLSFILLPMIFILSISYGAVGGALSWLLLHIMYLLLGTYLTHRRLLVGIGWRWLAHDVGVPMAATALIGAICWAVEWKTNPTPVATLALVTLAFFAAIALGYSMSRRHPGDIKRLLSAESFTVLAERQV